MPPASTDTIPSAPFIAWVEATIARYERLHEAPSVNDRDGYVALGPVERLVTEMGWDGPSGIRRLHRVRVGTTQGGSPTDVIDRGVVEDALDHAGVPLEDVYPDLVQDVELEPEAFCPKCHETVTPIGGVCPWCETATETATGHTRVYCPTEDRTTFAAQNGRCWRCGGEVRGDMPWAECACGCGKMVRRFDSSGREVRFARGHAPRSLERRTRVNAEPFAGWLEEQLRELDPIQSLARRVGMSREDVLAVLNRRDPDIDLGDVRRTLWLAGREGQGKGMPPRPGSTSLADLYPDYVRSKVCPGCGGGKRPTAELCKSCRKRAGNPNHRGRPASVTDDLVEEARQIREEEHLAFPAIARRLQPRTRCTNAESIANQLRIEFQRRGWPTGRLSQAEKAGEAA